MDFLNFFLVVIPIDFAHSFVDCDDKVDAVLNTCQDEIVGTQVGDDRNVAPLVVFLAHQLFVSELKPEILFQSHSVRTIDYPLNITHFYFKVLERIYIKN